MKKSVLSAVLTAALGLGVAGSALAADGTIKFTGKIIDSTCTISNPGGSSFEVKLPAVSTQTLSSSGARTARTPFSIQLTNCPAGLSAYAYFEPGANTTSDGHLRNTSSLAPAGNVEVEVLNASYAPINLMTNANQQAVVLSATGTNTLQYYAQYYATAPTTAGAVETQVDYTIVYP